nr:polyprotein [Rhizoctonia solani alphaendornavirus 1]
MSHNSNINGQSPYNGRDFEPTQNSDRELYEGRKKQSIRKDAKMDIDRRALQLLSFNSIKRKTVTAVGNIFPISGHHRRGSENSGAIIEAYKKIDTARSNRGTLMLNRKPIDKDTVIKSKVGGDGDCWKKIFGGVTEDMLENKKLPLRTICETISYGLVPYSLFPCILVGDECWGRMQHTHWDDDRSDWFKQLPTEVQQDKMLVAKRFGREYGIKFSIVGQDLHVEEVGVNLTGCVISFYDMSVLKLQPLVDLCNASGISLDNDDDPAKLAKVAKTEQCAEQGSTVTQTTLGDTVSLNELMLGGRGDCWLKLAKYSIAFTFGEKFAAGQDVDSDDSDSDTEDSEDDTEPFEQQPKPEEEIKPRNFYDCMRLLLLYGVDYDETEELDWRGNKKRKQFNLKERSEQYKLKIYPTPGKPNELHLEDFGTDLTGDDVYTLKDMWAFCKLDEQSPKILAALQECIDKPSVSTYEDRQKAFSGTQKPPQQRIRIVDRLLGGESDCWSALYEAAGYDTFPDAEWVENFDGSICYSKPKEIPDKPVTLLEFLNMIRAVQQLGDYEHIACHILKTGDSYHLENLHLLSEEDEWDDETMDVPEGWIWTCASWSNCKIQSHKMFRDIIENRCDKNIDWLIDPENYPEYEEFERPTVADMMNKVLKPEKEQPAVKLQDLLLGTKAIDDFLKNNGLSGSSAINVGTDEWKEAMEHDIVKVRSILSRTRNNIFRGSAGLNDEDIKILEKDMPSSVVLTHKSVPNQHALFASSRKACSQVMVELAAGNKVIDVGGDPTQHRRALSDVHVLRPMLNSQDLVRHLNKPLPDNPKVSQCSHTLAACSCDWSQSIPIFVDSIYDISPMEVLNTMHSRSIDTFYYCHSFRNTDLNAGKGMTSMGLGIYKTFEDDLVTALPGESVSYVNSQKYAELWVNANVIVHQQIWRVYDICNIGTHTVRAVVKTNETASIYKDMKKTQMRDTITLRVPILDVHAVSRLKWVDANLDSKLLGSLLDRNMNANLSFNTLLEFAHAIALTKISTHDRTFDLMRVDAESCRLTAWVAYLYAKRRTGWLNEIVLNTEFKNKPKYFFQALLNLGVPILQEWVKDNKLFENTEFVNIAQSLINNSILKTDDPNLNILFDNIDDLVHTAVIKPFDIRFLDRLADWKCAHDLKSDSNGTNNCQCCGRACNQSYCIDCDEHYETIRKMEVPELRQQIDQEIMETIIAQLSVTDFEKPTESVTHIREKQREPKDKKEQQSEQAQMDKTKANSAAVDKELSAFVEDKKKYSAAVTDTQRKKPTNHNELKVMANGSHIHKCNNCGNYFLEKNLTCNANNIPSRNDCPSCNELSQHIVVDENYFENPPTSFGTEPKQVQPKPEYSKEILEYGELLGHDYTQYLLEELVEYQTTVVPHRGGYKTELPHMPMGRSVYPNLSQIRTQDETILYNNDENCGFYAIKKLMPLASLPSMRAITGRDGNFTALDLITTAASMSENLLVITENYLYVNTDNTGPHHTILHDKNGEGHWNVCSGILVSREAMIPVPKLALTQQEMTSYDIEFSWELNARERWEALKPIMASIVADALVAVDVDPGVQLRTINDAQTLSNNKKQRHEKHKGMFSIKINDKDLIDTLSKLNEPTRETLSSDLLTVVDLPEAEAESLRYLRDTRIKLLVGNYIKAMNDTNVKWQNVKVEKSINVSRVKINYHKIKPCDNVLIQLPTGTVQRTVLRSAKHYIVVRTLGFVGSCKMYIPKQSIASILFEIEALNMLDVNRNIVEQMKRICHSHIGTFGSGKSTEMVARSKEKDVSTYAYTTGALNSLNEKGIKGGAMSVEKAKFDFKRQKIVQIDEATGMTLLDVAMVTDNRTEELHLYGDLKQIGLTDMNYAVGYRHYIQAMVYHKDKTENYKTLRTGEPLASIIKQIEPKLIPADHKTDYKIISLNEFDVQKLDEIISSHNIDTIFFFYDADLTQFRTHTNLDSGSLKLCKVHSNQGADGNNVMVVQNPRVKTKDAIHLKPEYLYTAVTRSKKITVWVTINLYTQNIKLEQILRNDVEIFPSAGKRYEHEDVLTEIDKKITATIQPQSGMTAVEKMLAHIGMMSVLDLMNPVAVYPKIDWPNCVLLVTGKTLDDEDEICAALSIMLLYDYTDSSSNSRALNNILIKPGGLNSHVAVEKVDGRMKKNVNNNIKRLLKGYMPALERLDKLISAIAIEEGLAQNSLELQLHMNKIYPITLAIPAMSLTHKLCIILDKQTRGIYYTRRLGLDSLVVVDNKQDICQVKVTSVTVKRHQLTNIDAVEFLNKAADEFSGYGVVHSDTTSISYINQEETLFCDNTADVLSVSTNFYVIHDNKVWTVTEENIEYKLININAAIKRQVHEHVDLTLVECITSISSFTDVVSNDELQLTGKIKSVADLADPILQAEVLAKKYKLNCRAETTVEGHKITMYAGYGILSVTVACCEFSADWQLKEITLGNGLAIITKSIGFDLTKDVEQLASLIKGDLKLSKIEKKVRGGLANTLNNEGDEDSEYDTASEGDDDEDTIVPNNRTPIATFFELPDTLMTTNEKTEEKDGKTAANVDDLIDELLPSRQTYSWARTIARKLNLEPTGQSSANTREHTSAPLRRANFYAVAVSELLLETFGRLKGQEDAKIMAKYVDTEEGIKVLSMAKQMTFDSQIPYINSQTTPFMNIEFLTRSAIFGSKGEASRHRPVSEVGSLVLRDIHQRSIKLNKLEAMTDSLVTSWVTGINFKVLSLHGGLLIGLYAPDWKTKGLMRNVAYRTHPITQAWRVMPLYVETHYGGHTFKMTVKKGCSMCTDFVIYDDNQVMLVSISAMYRKPHTRKVTINCNSPLAPLACELLHIHVPFSNINHGNPLTGDFNDVRPEKLLDQYGQNLFSELAHWAVLYDRLAAMTASWGKLLLLALTGKEVSNALQDDHGFTTMTYYREHNKKKYDQVAALGFASGLAMTDLRRDAVSFVDINSWVVSYNTVSDGNGFLHVDAEGLVTLAAMPGSKNVKNKIEQVGYKVNMIKPHDMMGFTSELERQRFYNMTPALLRKVFLKIYKGFGVTPFDDLIIPFDTHRSLQTTVYKHVAKYASRLTIAEIKNKKKITYIPVDTLDIVHKSEPTLAYNMNLEEHGDTVMSKDCLTLVDTIGLEIVGKMTHEKFKVHGSSLTAMVSTSRLKHRIQSDYGPFNRDRVREESIRVRPYIKKLSELLATNSKSETQEFAQWLGEQLKDNRPSWLNNDHGMAAVNYVSPSVLEKDLSTVDWPMNTVAYMMVPFVGTFPTHCLMHENGEWRLSYTQLGTSISVAHNNVNIINRMKVSEDTCMRIVGVHLNHYLLEIVTTKLEKKFLNYISDPNRQRGKYITYTMPKLDLSMTKWLKADAMELITLKVPANVDRLLTIRAQRPDCTWEDQKQYARTLKQTTVYNKSSTKDLYKSTSDEMLYWAAVTFIHTKVQLNNIHEISESKLADKNRAMGLASSLYHRVKDILSALFMEVTSRLHVDQSWLDVIKNIVETYEEVEGDTKIGDMLRIVKKFQVKKTEKVYEIWKLDQQSTWYTEGFKDKLVPDKPARLQASRDARSVIKASRYVNLCGKSKINVVAHGDALQCVMLKALALDKQYEYIEIQRKTHLAQHSETMYQDQMSRIKTEVLQKAITSYTQLENIDADRVICLSDDLGTIFRCLTKGIEVKLIDNMKDDKIHNTLADLLYMTQPISDEVIKQIMSNLIGVGKAVGVYDAYENLKPGELKMSTEADIGENDIVLHSNVLTKLATEAFEQEMISPEVAMVGIGGAHANQRHVRRLIDIYGYDESFKWLKSHDKLHIEVAGYVIRNKSVVLHDFSYWMHKYLLGIRATQLYIHVGSHKDVADFYSTAGLNSTTDIERVKNEQLQSMLDAELSLGPEITAEEDDMVTVINNSWNMVKNKRSVLITHHTTTYPAECIITPFELSKDVGVVVTGEERIMHIMVLVIITIYHSRAEMFYNNTFNETEQWMKLIEADQRKPWVTVILDSRGYLLFIHKRPFKLGNKVEPAEHLPMVMDMFDNGPVAMFSGSTPTIKYSSAVPVDPIDFSGLIAKHSPRSSSGEKQSRTDEESDSEDDSDGEDFKGSKPLKPKPHQTNEETQPDETDDANDAAYEGADESRDALEESETRAARQQAVAEDNSTAQHLKLNKNTYPTLLNSKLRTYIVKQEDITYDPGATECGPKVLEKLGVVLESQETGLSPSDFAANMLSSHKNVHYVELGKLYTTNVYDIGDTVSAPGLIDAFSLHWVIANWSITGIEEPTRMATYDTLATGQCTNNKQQVFIIKNYFENQCENHTHSNLLTAYKAYLTTGIPMSKIFARNKDEFTALMTKHSTLEHRLSGQYQPGKVVDLTATLDGFITHEPVTSVHRGVLIVTRAGLVRAITALGDNNTQSYVIKPDDMHLAHSGMAIVIDARADLKLSGKGNKKKKITSEVMPGSFLRRGYLNVETIKQLRLPRGTALFEQGAFNNLMIAHFDNYSHHSVGDRRMEKQIIVDAIESGVFVECSEEWFEVELFVMEFYFMKFEMIHGTIFVSVIPHPFTYKAAEEMNAEIHDDGEMIKIALNSRKYDIFKNVLNDCFSLNIETCIEEFRQGLAWDDLHVWMKELLPLRQKYGVTTYDKFSGNPMACKFPIILDTYAAAGEFMPEYRTTVVSTLSLSEIEELDYNADVTGLNFDDEHAVVDSSSDFEPGFKVIGGRYENGKGHIPLTNQVALQNLSKVNRNLQTLITEIKLYTPITMKHINMILTELDVMPKHPNSEDANYAMTFLDHDERSCYLHITSLGTCVRELNPAGKRKEDFTVEVEHSEHSQLQKLLEDDRIGWYMDEGTRNQDMLIRQTKAKPLYIVCLCSGGGKSTICNLDDRFADPDKYVILQLLPSDLQNMTERDWVVRNDAGKRQLYSAGNQLAGKVLMVWHPDNIPDQWRDVPMLVVIIDDVSGKRMFNVNNDSLKAYVAKHPKTKNVTLTRPEVYQHLLTTIFPTVERNKQELINIDVFNALQLVDVENNNLSYDERALTKWMVPFVNATGTTVEQTEGVVAKPEDTDIMSIDFFNTPDHTDWFDIKLPKTGMKIKSKEVFGEFVIERKSTLTKWPKFSRPVMTKPIFSTLNSVTSRYGELTVYRKKELNAKEHLRKMVQVYFHGLANSMIEKFKAKPIKIDGKKTMDWLNARKDREKVATDLLEILSEGVGIHKVNAINIHAKLESLLKQDPIQKPEEQKVRLIAWQRYGLAAIYSPVFLEAKKRLKMLLREEIIYADGYTANELSARLRSVRNVERFFESDMAKQDRQTDHETLRLEFEMYKILGVHTDVLSSWQAVHKNWRWKSKLHSGYSDAMRLTGQATTALGNVIVNMAVHTDLIWTNYSKVFLVLMLGDDNMFLTNAWLDLQKFKRDTQELFNMEVVPDSHPDYGTFIQLIAYKTPEGGCELAPDWIRLSRRFEVTNGVSESNDENLKARAMSYAMMLGALPEVMTLVAEQNWPIQPFQWYEPAQAKLAIAEKHSVSIATVEQFLAHLINMMRYREVTEYNWKVPAALSGNKKKFNK